MSTVKFDTWQNTDGTENYKCRAWVNFDGTGTVAIRASGNVSSITDNGVGRYGANFTNPLPDSNYSAVTVNANREGGCYNYSTTAVAIFAGETAVDSTDISLAIFR